MTAPKTSDDARLAQVHGRSTIIPCLRYRDAHAAIEWLCKVFGFERHAVYTDEEGHVAHAQLTLGGGMVMLGSASRESDWGKLIKQPDEVGGVETQSACLVVADPDAVYSLVKSEGGRILVSIKDESYGGRGFTCADPEGHIWNIGNYQPW